MVWRIAASGATSADSSTATGTRSSARQAGGASLANASRHDRDVLALYGRGPDDDVATVRRLFHVPTYLLFHLREEGAAACVNARVCTRPYAPQIYKYGRGSARRISNNRAVKYRRWKSPGERFGASNTVDGLLQRIRRKVASRPWPCVFRPDASICDVNEIRYSQIFLEAT